MKRIIKTTLIILSLLESFFIFTSCNNSGNASSEESTDPITRTNTTTSEPVDPIVEARQNVIDKWKKHPGEPETSGYIERMYKEYPNDEVIANIYYYCISVEQYNLYLRLDDEKYKEIAKEYASKIDPDYKGEFYEKIQKYADSTLGYKRKSAYKNAKSTEDKYNSLTNADKKEICNYIQSLFDYYDSATNGQSEKYTNQIWKTAAEKYGLTETQIDIIWTNMYNY